MDQPLVLQFRPLARLGFRQVAVETQGVELLEARRVGMEGDERVQQVERDVDGFPVAQAFLPGGELVE